MSKPTNEGAAYLARKIQEQSKRHGRERSEADCRREANERLTRSENRENRGK